MKKFLTLVLPAIFAVVFIGCKEPEPEPVVEEATASADSVTVSETLKADESYVAPTEDTADTLIENLIKDLSKDENAEKMLEAAAKKIYDNIKIVGFEENAAKSITVDLTSLSQFIKDLQNMNGAGETSFNVSVPAGSVIDESGLKVDVEKCDANGNYKLDMDVSGDAPSGSMSIGGSANAKASASIDFEKFDPELSKDSIIKSIYCNAILTADVNIAVDIVAQDISGSAAANCSYGASMVFVDNGVAGILVANSNMSFNVDDAALKSMMSGGSYSELLENAISGNINLSLYDLDGNEITTKTISAEELLSEISSGFDVDD